MAIVDAAVAATSVTAASLGMPNPVVTTPVSIHVAPTLANPSTVINTLVSEPVYTYATSTAANPTNPPHLHTSTDPLNGTHYYVQDQSFLE